MASPQDANARAVQIFDEAANSYALKYADVSTYDPAFQRFAAALPQRGRVLELGCGPGNATARLLNLRPDLDWLATDLAPNMLAEAQKRHISARFELRDAKNPIRTGEAFDGIFAAFLLPYFDDDQLRRLLSQSHAAMSTSGLLLLSFMEADAALSGWETGSGGQRIYMHYRSAQAVIQAANFGFNMLMTQRFPIDHSQSVCDVALIFERK